MTSFIAELKARLPQADWPAAVTALRSEARVWAALQDAGFAAQALEATGCDRERWSPAFLGLLSLGQAQHFEALRSAPMQAVAEKLRYQAAAAFEKLASEANMERPAPGLAEATLLALALRERRRLLNGWEQLGEDLGVSGNQEFWKLPVAILFGMLPNPHELLAYLIAPEQNSGLQQLGIHALVSNPLPLDVQSAHLLELVRDFPLPEFMTLLRSVANASSALAQQAAVQALENLQDEGADDDNGLAEIQRLLLEAEVNQISGQSEQADVLLRSAWEASRQLEADLAGKLAEARGLDAESIAELQKSVGPRKSERKSKRPAALLAAAKVAFNSDDPTEAKEMALAALKAADEGPSTADNRKGAVLRELSDLFADLHMPDEALKSAEMAAHSQPNDAASALHYAQLLQANEKTSEALQQAHLAAALDPGNSSVRRNLARSLQHNQLHEEAYREWQAMLDNEVEPTVEDWLAYAEAGLHSDHFDETIKACQYALALQPTNGAAYALIGSALIAQGDEGSALAHLRRATELAPAQSEAWLALAGLQLQQHDADQALETLVAAQQFTPPTAKSQQLFGAAYQALDRLEEALTAYSNAAKLANDASDILTAQSVALKISRLQEQLGYRDAALHILEAAQRSFPNNAAIAAQLGKVLLSFDQPKRALSSLKQALQAEPDNIELLMDIARAQISVSELAAEAEQTLEIILARKDAPVEAKALIAETKAAQGKHSEAVKAFEAASKALATDKAWSKRLALGKARSLAASGKPVAAIAALEALEKEQPGDLEVQRELCVCCQQAGRGEEAAQLAEKLFGANAQDEATLLWYADVMDALGKSAQACKTLSDKLGKASKAEGASPRVILSLAKLQWSGESPEAAKKTLAHISRLNDGGSSALAGKFLLERGAPKESIAYFKRALDLSAPNLDVLQNLASACIQTEQWAGALDALDQAIPLAPNKPQTLEQKAGVLLKLGKPQAALETIENSLQILPNDLNLLAQKTNILRDQQDWNSALGAAIKAFELDRSHPGSLQTAAELAVLCLQNELARELIGGANLTAKPNFALVCLKAELALDAGLEIEAARSLGDVDEQNHPRVLALQSRLAACRGDRGQATQLLRQAFEALGRLTQADGFASIGVARAAEKLNDWQTAISLYEGLARSFPGQTLAQFCLGSSILLRAEWQKLCEASQAKTKDAGGAFSKEARSACKRALSAALTSTTDAAAQAMIAGWQARAELRFAAKPDLNALPAGYPSNPAEAAALLAAAHRVGEPVSIQERISPFAQAPEVLVERVMADLDLETQAALENIRQAAVVLLQSAPVQALAAQILRKAGELIEALPFVQRALAQWPEQTNWQALAGEIQQALGNLMEARSHFKTAAQLEPEESKHHFALGKLQLAAHAIPEGIQNLEQAIKLEPKRAEYSLALAGAYRLAGDRAQAKSFAQQAQKLAPQNLDALLLQSELALEAGEAQGAKGLAQQALKLDPHDPAALSLFAEALSALGETEDAIAVLDRARETADDEVPILIRRASLLPAGRGLDALVRLSQRYPDRAEIFFALSRALADAGAIADAILAAQRAAKKAGKDAPNEQLAGIHLHLGRLLKRSGNLDQSLHHLDQAAKLAPHSAASHIERGRVFQARRQPQQALQAFRQAAALAPNDAAPHFELGLALKEAKDFNAAEAELRKAARLSPKDRQIQRQLAAVIALNIVHHPVGEALQADKSEPGNPQQKLQELSL